MGVSEFVMELVLLMLGSAAVVIGFGVAAIMMMNARHRHADELSRAVINRRVDDSISGAVGSSYHQVA